MIFGQTTYWQDIEEKGSGDVVLSDEQDGAISIGVKHSTNFEIHEKLSFPTCGKVSKFNLVVDIFCGASGNGGLRCRR